MKYNPTKFNKICIFKLKIVNKIKSKAIVGNKGK